MSRLWEVLVVISLLGVPYKMSVRRRPLETPAFPSFAVLLPLSCPGIEDVAARNYIRAWKIRERKLEGFFF